MLAAEFAIVLILIAVNGLLAMSELAIVSARRARLKAMAARGRRGARAALALAADPGRFLSSVQIGITLVGILAGAFSGATLGERLAGWLLSQGVPDDVAEPASVALVVGLITYLSVIGGELVPKRLALRNPEPVACTVAPAMQMLARLGAPAVWLLDMSSRAVLSLFGRRGEGEAKVTDEEIKMLVAEAESAGMVEPEERAMIAAVLRLGDRRVRAVMTPRHEVHSIDLSEPADTVRRRLVESPHSRLVVFEGPMRDAVGIIQAKDALDAVLGGVGFEPHRLVRPAPVIPETLEALEAVRILKESPVHLALVHDEYGHFEGVVTLADILESIAGEFHDEDGPAEPKLTAREDGSYLVAGAMPADELADTLGFPLPQPAAYSTVAGMLLTAFGRLPVEGEAVTVEGWRFEVLDLDGRRIDKVLATRGPAEYRGHSWDQ
ncbi:MAG: hemolysin family protein [Alphaproteobacteria bacterium]